MSLKRSAKTKGYIKNIETGETKKFQFNPTTFSYTQGAMFNQTNSPLSPYPLITYAYGNSSVIPITLNMFGAESLNEIEDFIRFVESFLPQRSTASFKERTPKPKLMLFCYGTFIKKCVLQDFTYTHNRYSEAGVPIETVLMFNILEVSGVSEDPFSRPQLTNLPKPSNDKSGNTGVDEIIVIPNPITIEYSPHCENLAWLPYVKDGETGGTTGQGLRLEAIKARLIISGELDISLKYQAHIQGIGWDTICNADEICGTVGEATRLEALKFFLEGSDAYKYDLFYRIHVENLGWMEWTKNGLPVGSAGYSLRGEAIQMMVTPRL